MKCEAINLSKYIGKSPNIFFIFGSEIILKNHVKSRILETLASRGFSEKIILSDENFKEIKSTIADNKIKKVIYIKEKIINFVI